MNEAETRAELIDPALREAGWGVVTESRTRREVIAPGRIMGRGRRGKPLSCDYVLVYRNTKLATIEAKAATKSYTEGVGQTKDYATRLLTRFAFATNGKDIYRIDMQTGAEGLVDAFPSPQELWDATFASANAWRDRFAAVAYETSGGRFEPRYYQHNAIERVLEAISQNRDRILLTLATGTGKTAIAFQIAWKLFHARWNLGDWKAGGEPTRRPRILFLADRNILADQAYNSFSAFDDGALARVKPDEIRKKGAVPKNASVFFTIFQTFTSGTDADGEPAPYFGDYPPDFFDCIIIDECHRGGAKDESEWRAILEYFAPAVQIGLTATPKRTNNTDTYRYFGEPVYTYSLKEGINDGYLTPFKVRQIATTLDEYVFTPDDQVLEGMAEDGAIGDQWLRTFQDNDKTIPTILTTSQKLSTGVDARNVRNIVLMRPVNSMIEFKQIIGRGTRLFEGKDYFTILDFVKAYEQFKHPEWDGEPLEPEPAKAVTTGTGATVVKTEEPGADAPVDAPPARIKVKLADGKARNIQHMTATTFWSADGRPMSAAQFLEVLYGALPEFFKDEDELRRIWSLPDTRKTLLAGLADKGFGREPLAEMQKVIEAENSDLFDVLAYVAFAAPPVTRVERAAAAKAASVSEFNDKQQAFVDFVLAQYVKQGVDELDQEKLPPLLQLKYRALSDAFKELGRPDQVRRMFVGFQRHLYERQISPASGESRPS